jgi:hypothetical protein
MLHGADPNEAHLQGCEVAEDLFKRGGRNGKSIAIIGRSTTGRTWKAGRKDMEGRKG